MRVIVFAFWMAALTSELARASEKIPASIYCAPRPGQSQPAYQTSENPFLNDEVFYNDEMLKGFVYYSENYHRDIKGYMAELCKSQDDASVILESTATFCRERCDVRDRAETRPRRAGKGKYSPVVVCKELCQRQHQLGQKLLKSYELGMKQGRSACAGPDKKSD